MNKSNKTLLVVDDEALIAMAEADLLESAGYTVVQAYSGESALDIIRTENSKIDLVLMDIDLGKGMNGIETTREIKKSHKVPVIFLSSYPENSMGDKLDGISAYGYIKKRSSETELFDAIQMVFKIHE